jgi:hypothetical protein
MGSRADRSAADWFVAAMHWHLEEHQGCPSCRGRHCVFRSQWGTRVEYYCTACDFSVGQDTATGTATFTRGQQQGPAPGLPLQLGALS